MINVTLFCNYETFRGRLKLLGLKKLGLKLLGL